MKLIFCKKCQDVIRLIEVERVCKCGKSKGKYLDEVHAEYSGAFAVPIGFANSTLVDAVERQPEFGKGKIFNAFVIPKECETFNKVE